MPGKPRPQRATGSVEGGKVVSLYLSAQSRAALGVVAALVYGGNESQAADRLIAAALEAHDDSAEALGVALAFARAGEIIATARREGIV